MTTSILRQEGEAYTLYVGQREFPKREDYEMGISEHGFEAICMAWFADAKSYRVAESTIEYCKAYVKEEILLPDLEKGEWVSNDSYELMNYFDDNWEAFFKTPEAECNCPCIPCICKTEEETKSCNRNCVCAEKESEAVNWEKVEWPTNDELEQIIKDVLNETIQEQAKELTAYRSLLDDATKEIDRLKWFENKMFSSTNNELNEIVSLKKQLTESENKNDEFWGETLNLKKQLDEERNEYRREIQRYIDREAERQNEVNG